MGAIIDGVYHSEVVKPATDKPSTTVSNIHEQAKFQRIYEKHAHELIQPNKPDGTPNQDFIDYYPEDAKNHGFVPESENQ